MSSLLLLCLGLLAVSVLVVVVWYACIKAIHVSSLNIQLERLPILRPIAEQSGVWKLARNKVNRSAPRIIVIEFSDEDADCSDTKSLNTTGSEGAFRAPPTTSYGSV
jgi:hypothetical protein